MDRSIETSPYMTGFTRHGISPQNHLEFQQFQHAQTRCGLRNHGTKFGVAMWSNECKNAERIITCFMAGPARRVIAVVNTPGMVRYVPYRRQPWKIVPGYVGISVRRAEFDFCVRMVDDMLALANPVCLLSLSRFNRQIFALLLRTGLIVLCCACGRCSTITCSVHIRRGPQKTMKMEK